jgi:hypothetical protein
LGIAWVCTTRHFERQLPHFQELTMLNSSKIPVSALESAKLG